MMLEKAFPHGFKPAESLENRTFRHETGMAEAGILKFGSCIVRQNTNALNRSRFRAFPHFAGKGNRETSRRDGKPGNPEADK
ncbi:hypothetical protein [Dysosmobacter sp.]|uniref:hypothetical protein n=1 Tax=Dysosmobacter sp. TaxID=2591382 RepID=UPI002D7F8F43|nr:hypothetical protein [Dysosmobacter sp.]